MKAFGWTILIIIVAIIAMIILTVISQTGLLQTRARHGIGSQADNAELLP